MDPKPAKTVASLVVAGPVNPALFHPVWFKNNDLLREAEADEAEIQIVTPDLTLFKTEWLEVDIRNNRLQLRTHQEPYFPILRDLMLGCLALMPTVPFTQIGFNWENLYNFQKIDDYHALGHRLAPKEPWGDKMVNPGMVRITVRSDRDDGRKGYKDFTISPTLGSSENEVKVSVNDHVAFDPKETVSADQAHACIAEYWEKSLEQFSEISAHMIAGE